MEIKVLGPGCAKCEQAEAIVREAAAESGQDIEIVKVSNPMDIAKAGVFGTPAVIVDGRVKAVGKVPTKADVLSWIGS
jgi:small redox-active disulfide protein 2